MSDDELKAAIRKVLLRCARAGETITYGTLGQIIGRTPRGPWKRTLDAIRDEERAEGRPDLGCIVVKVTTGFPSYVKDTDSDRDAALAERRHVFDRHRM